MKDINVTRDIAIVSKDSKVIRWLRRKKIKADLNGYAIIINDGREVYYNFGLIRWEYQLEK